MKYKTASNKKIAVFKTLGIIALLGITLYATIHYVYAAGKAVTLNPTSLAAATATEVTYHFVSTAEYGIGDTVTIVAAGGVTVASCASSTTDADADATPDGSALIVSQTYTYLFSAATTDATSTGVTFCIKYTAATGNY